MLLVNLGNTLRDSGLEVLKDTQMCMDYL